jgi:hypothetical protein
MPSSIMERNVNKDLLPCFFVFFYLAPVAVPQIVDVQTLSSRKVEVKWEVISQYTVISSQAGHMWHQHFDRNGQIF